MCHPPANRLGSEHARLSNSNSERGTKCDRVNSEGTLPLDRAPEQIRQRVGNRERHCVRADGSG